ncbi:elongation of very long chain fatty acids protein-like protein [Dinothrombium tinctorium]|uniref:Elongation of very long chain fatty acids protein n=1 Tax=Dinothrombium tinctorium TaxID=1965070 RepID=A0A3S3NUM2_9ACAR|nr:elongation of very long chain fatty acids protein-like protein [Dinothrombium tinctorium]
MPFSVWWGVKFAPGGHGTFFGFLNSFVHIIMYTYFGLAAIGPRMNKYLWWKRYLTMIQMIQFILVFVHSFQIFFRDCNFPKIFGVWLCAQSVLFWFLFYHFYRNTYSNNARNGNLLFAVCSPNESLIKDMNDVSSKTTASEMREKEN